MGRLSNTTGILQTPLLRKILGLLLFKNILGLNHRKRSDKNEKFSPRRDTFFRLQLYEKVRFFYERTFQKYPNTATERVNVNLSDILRGPKKK